MFLFLLLVFAHPSAGWAAPETRPAAEADGGDSEDYEIDYEEEEAAASRPAARTRSAGGPAVQGSRAKNRFVPILKSETRSVYQKGGKPYDVDTD